MRSYLSSDPRLEKRFLKYEGKKKENCIVISVDSIVFSEEDDIITVKPGRNNKKVRPDTITKRMKCKRP